jgi:soluble lytic murein transglycosylase-like protein
MAERVIHLRGGEVLPPEEKPASSPRPKPKPKPARSSRPKPAPKPKPAPRPSRNRKPAGSTLPPALRKVLEMAELESLAPWLFLLLLGGKKSGKRSPGKAPAGVRQWIPMVKEATAGTVVPAGIVLAIIEHESGGRQDATLLNKNGSTDWGLMQINDITLQTYDVPRSMAMNPEVNIATGVALLEDLWDRWRDWKYAIAAYAAGSGGVKKTYPQLSPRLQKFVKYVLDRAGSYGV